MEKLDLFVRYLQNAKKYSEHTIEAYSLDLKQFKEFLGINTNRRWMSHFQACILEVGWQPLGKNGIDNRSIQKKTFQFKPFL